MVKGADPHEQVRQLTNASGVRPVFSLVGKQLIAIAAMMLLPLALDLTREEGEWQAYAISAALTFVLGIGLTSVFRCRLSSGLDLRQAFLLTPLSWLLVAVAGALPLYFSSFGIVSGSATNAFFESMSGLTTTGSTVITKLDDAPHALLLWRALLHWIGGIGIIAVAIALLPALGIGGMQLFRTESSDRSEKAMPRVRQIAASIGLVYVGLTALAALSYWVTAMTPFEAITHAFATVSTGGFSTSDSSFSKWEANGIQWFGTLFMLSGSLPFILYVRFLAGERHALWDRQVKTLIGFLAVVIVTLALWLVISAQKGVYDAFRLAAFNVVSIVSTTGFMSADYLLWGNFAVAIFFGLTFIGGCTGSTAGGIKIFRFEAMASLLRSHFSKLIYPNGVFPRRYAGKPLSDDVVGSVVVFFSIFFVCYSAITIILMSMNLDFATSASAAVTALANVGPGIGATIGPAGNFSTLPDGAKWVLSFAMLLGRLELFTVLILLMPKFWRG